MLGRRVWIGEGWLVCVLHISQYNHANNPLVTTNKGGRGGGEVGGGGEGGGFIHKSVRAEETEEGTVTTLAKSRRVFGWRERKNCTLVTE